MDGADEAVVDVVERLPYISVLGLIPGSGCSLRVDHWEIWPVR